MSMTTRKYDELICERMQKNESYMDKTIINQTGSQNAYRRLAETNAKPTQKQSVFTRWTIQVEARSI
jgi:hypothetical protein